VLKNMQVAMSSYSKLSGIGVDIGTATVVLSYRHEEVRRDWQGLRVGMPIARTIAVAKELRKSTTEKYSSSRVCLGWKHHCNMAPSCLGTRLGTTRAVKTGS